ncbi:MAG: TldD/PmbA family protein [Nitrospirota bacterium]
MGRVRQHAAIKQQAETILSRSQDLNVDAAEVFLRHSRSTSIEVKDQKVEAFDRAEDRGAGLRVLIGSHMGFAFTTDFSNDAIATLVKTAATNARNTEPDQFHSLPEKPSTPYPDVSLYDPEIVSLAEQEKIDRVMAIEREAFGVDARIKRVRKASAGFVHAETYILNSKGAQVFYQSTLCSAGIETVAEESGESQAGYEFDINRFYQNVSFEKTGRKAAQRALDLLGAKRIGSVKVPVILEAPVAQEFLGLFAAGLAADTVQKKKSLFLNCLGQQVASSKITLLDNGLLEHGLGSAPSDDELVPMQKKTILDKGKLISYLYNTYTANRDNTLSTGNGIRGGFAGIPGVSITNLYIEPGKPSLEELIGSLDQGLFVTEVMGMHTANSISGDFSVGATGFWIERGSRVYPVREITIAGNLLHLMKQINGVGNDIRFLGRIGSPSLRVEELSVGGI